jgi:hypothetical protein
LCLKTVEQRWEPGTEILWHTTKAEYGGAVDVRARSKALNGPERDFLPDDHVTFWTYPT